MPSWLSRPPWCYRPEEPIAQQLLDNCAGTQRCAPGTAMSTVLPLVPVASCHLPSDDRNGKVGDLRDRLRLVGWKKVGEPGSCDEALPFTALILAEGDQRLFKRSSAHSAEGGGGCDGG